MENYTLTDHPLGSDYAARGLPDVTNDLAVIDYYLIHLDHVLAGLTYQIECLEEQGIFDQIPAFSWEERNGKGRYLRLVYPTQYGKRRRQYVGCQATNIQAAHDKLKRTHDHARLLDQHEQLNRFLATTRANIQQIRRGVERWGQRTLELPGPTTPNAQARRDA